MKWKQKDGTGKMVIEDIKKWIEVAVTQDPPLVITEYCGQQYSPYYHLMYLVAKNFRGVAVELGVEKGRGSFALCQGGASVYGIDHTFKALDVLDNCPSFVFIHQDSMPIPDQIEKLSISILHIDTEHSQAQAKTEFEAYKPLLADEAIILFDDLHANEDGVMEFFMTLEYPKIQDDRLHPSCGYGIVLYERKHEILEK